MLKKSTVHGMSRVSIMILSLEERGHDSRWLFIRLTTSSREPVKGPVDSILMEVKAVANTRESSRE